jgi:hypothetical protein
VVDITQESRIEPSKVKRSKFLPVSMFCALSLSAAVLASNFISAERHALSVLEADSRNHGLSIWAYYRFGIIPDSMVVDIRGMSEGNAPIDVMRALFQIAERMKDREFSEVRLAYHGETRYILEGEHFHRIGQEYAFQNPVYTIQTLPEHLYTLDGARAFETWTGGWLGVMNARMKDFSTFTETWFLHDERLQQ